MFERLMRSLLVVALDEAIELRLLLQEVLRRRFGGFLLQRQMHALVPAVLLRIAGLDALDARSPGAATTPRACSDRRRRCAGEGNAVVGADRQRQAEVLESPLKHGKGVALLGRRQGIAAQQIAAGEVGDRQRIAVALDRRA